MQSIKPLLICALVFFASCKQAKKISNPPGYDLSAPEIFEMPAALNEISGISFNNSNADMMYAEQDEDGRLFYFSLPGLDVKHIKFGKKGDYEDIAISRGKVLILRSDGALFSFPLNEIANGEAVNVAEQPGVLPKGEYEAMCVDESTDRVYVLCKECDQDNAAKSITGYILEPDSAAGFLLESQFNINTKDIADLGEEKRIIFRPAALAKNKLTGEWYIVSSVNKLMVVAESNWKVKGVYKLDAKLFYQPEGIAFDNDHSMYISNERGVFENARILKYTFKDNGK